MENEIFKYKLLPQAYDYPAPDGSEIRLMPDTTRGGCAHCVLPAGKISKAVKHKTVEEIWYVIEGNGEMWQKCGKEEKVVALTAGAGITIPVGNHFQFRNTGNEPLKILILTMPPWPGEQEAVGVNGTWQ